MRALFHFAKTTFCWLPPEKSRTRTDGPGALIEGLCDRLLRLGCLRAAAHPACPREMGKAWQAEIALDRVIEDKALHLAIFRYERDAFFDRRRRPPKTANLAANPEFAAR